MNTKTEIAYRAEIHYWRDDISEWDWMELGHYSTLEKAQAHCNQVMRTNTHHTTQNRSTAYTRRMKKILALTIIAMTTTTSTAAARTPRPHTEARRAYAICQTFGPRYCHQALRVARCESNLDPKAKNGQYLGVFQMGAHERRTYGHHHSNTWKQAQAAKRYWIATGKTWGPWECKP